MTEDEERAENVELIEARLAALEVVTHEIAERVDRMLVETAQLLATSTRQVDTRSTSATKDLRGR